MSCNLHKSSPVPATYLWTYPGPRAPPSIILPAGRGQRQRRERRQKQGCGADPLGLLWRRSQRSPVSSIFLMNARPLVNKIDELGLQVEMNRTITDSCVLLITKTWLHSSVPELAGRTAHGHDRTMDSSKSRAGGLCTYTNDSWCTDTRTLNSHCSTELEFVTVKCRSFYLQREYTVVMISAVCVPSANLAMGNTSAETRRLFTF